MGDTGQHPGGTWYDATRVAAPERRALTHDLDVDLCVIGAGLAGLTVAREVARRGWDVAVIETDRVGAHASGRNAGFVSPGFAERIDTIVDRVGLPRARELWALSEHGVDYVRHAIGDCAMPGVDPRDGRLTVRRTDDEAGNIEHVAMLRVEFGAEVEAWPTEQVREVLRSPCYFQAMHFANGFHVHALNYALGLAAAAEALGVRIFEGTTATAVDPSGVRKRVQTSGGLVRARHVVLAGNVRTGLIDRELGATVLPLSTYVAVTAPLGERLFEAVRYSGAVADTRRAGDYYRVVADDRLMWGGRFTTRAGEPRRLKALMRRDIARTYPQLAGVEIEYAWAGTMGYALHKMPQVGELAPGYWLAGAFGGHGLNTTAMAGQLIAGAILDGDDRWRLFSPYELVWAGGRWGRAAAQAIAWTVQGRDALAGRIARYRDAARRQGAIQQAQWAEHEAKRRAEEEARRAEAEAKRLAEEDARRAEEAMRKAELEVRRASEQARRAAQADAARRARERVEAARRARDEVEVARLTIRELADRASDGTVEQAADTAVTETAAAVPVQPVAMEPGVTEPGVKEAGATEPVAAVEPTTEALPAVEPAVAESPVGTAASSAADAASTQPASEPKEPPAETVVPASTDESAAADTTEAPTVAETASQAAVKPEKKKAARKRKSKRAVLRGAAASPGTSEPDPKLSQ